MVELSVSDLPRAAEWCRRVFELPEPDLEPVDGVVDFFVLVDPDGNVLSLYSMLRRTNSVPSTRAKEDES